MRLEDVMTQPVQRVAPHSTLQETAEIMRASNVGFLPVVENTKVLGVVTDRDIAVRGVAPGLDPIHSKTSDIMTTEVVWCFEDEDVDEAARIMGDREIRRIVVLDRNRSLTGIFSLADLAYRTQDERLTAEVMEQVSG